MIRVIWDAHWEAIHHESAACMRFGIYLEEKINVEADERAPCQAEIKHIMDAMGRVPELIRYSEQGRKMLEFAESGLHMRMVASECLEEFYDMTTFCK